MRILLHCGICLFWISVSVLLHGSAFTSNISNQNQLTNMSVVKDQEDMDWDSPFLQLRASLPSFSQLIRPYSLLTNADYHYMPKPKHCRPSRLLRLLGSFFDPFWMSIDQPTESSKGGKFNLSASPELREAAVAHRQKLEDEAAQLDLDSLPSDVASSIRGWLVRSTTCELRHWWVDLGPTFWPRWLRQTDCKRPDGEKSCSFPRGMECVKAQTSQIKILAWHCLEIRNRRDGSRWTKRERSDGSTERREAMTRCLWRQVPYPVITSCMCSCI
ncbi:noggin-2-like [Leuresthes tenuis]|uniref:noggin-2-like n=1 Tax=Leuresthes tenuis TaxID=355514 RepID=UPI003B50DDF0